MHVVCVCVGVGVFLDVIPRFRVSSSSNMNKGTWLGIVRGLLFGLDNGRIG